MPVPEEDIAAGTPGETLAGLPTGYGSRMGALDPWGHIDQGQRLHEDSDARRFQLNQALEIRGGLRFNYAATRNSVTPLKRWLPFYENPTIVESRKANYANTKIFLRNEPVRLWTGSEARKFKVDVHYSLIHIASMMPTKEIFKHFAGLNRDLLDHELTQIKRYINDVVERDTGAKRASMSPAQAIAKLEERGNTFEGPWGPMPGTPDCIWNNSLVWVMSQMERWVDLTRLVQYCITHIRNSVIGTGTRSETHPGAQKGPPIIELKWGAMYDFTPCIATDYRIQAMENAGYDSKSLIPQRLKISITLEEMRNVHGNLWGNPKITGFLPGWDAVLDLGTIDPPTSQVRGGASQSWPK